MRITSVDFRNSIANMVAVAMDDIYHIDEDGNITGRRMYRMGDKIGLATGYVIRYAETSGDFVEIYNSNKNSISFVRIILLDFQENKNNTTVSINAQSDLDKLLSTQVEIMDNLIAASSIAMAAECNGMDVSSYRIRIKQLYLNLAERNQKLIDSGFIENEVKGATMLSDLSDDLGRVLKDKPAIGIEATTILIIKASIILVFAVIAYVTIKTLLTGGKDDLDEARKLVAEISKLDPEQAKAAKDILGKYYSSSGIKDIVIYGAIGLAAFLGFKYLFPKIK